MQIQINGLKEKIAEFLNDSEDQLKLFLIIGGVPEYIKHQTFFHFLNLFFTIKKC